MISFASHFGKHGLSLLVWTSCPIRPHPTPSSFILSSVLSCLIPSPPVLSPLVSSCSLLFEASLLRCALLCTHVRVSFSVWLKSSSACSRLAPFHYFIFSSSVHMAKSTWRTLRWRNSLILCFMYRPDMTTVKCQWGRGSTVCCLSSLCLSLFEWLESHFLAVSDEIWVVTVKYLLISYESQVFSGLF